MPIKRGFFVRCGAAARICGIVNGGSKRRVKILADIKRPAERLFWAKNGRYFDYFGILYD
ncbi:hypothetical protein [Anaerocaecibacter muris]|uniref:hypothetical protein n=1 Tax=Anaerocaecibacter muris TaxID=2941513 RepID=UPI00203A6187|nr:hypothetical protein [Anaerocaecibacter muris]